MIRKLAFAALALAAGIGAFVLLRPAPPVVPNFHADGMPALLSDWGIVAARKDHLVLGQDVVPYDLNTTLFTDYAGKLRTIWIPKGKSATYDAVNTFDFPVGTIISKTFYYPLVPSETPSSAKVRPALGALLQTGTDGLDLSHVRLIETRLLVHRLAGWIALPYVWNQDQNDAQLMRIGARADLALTRDDGSVENFTYAVPNANQCASCHTPNHASRQISPIGPKARHLNRDFAYTTGHENQLAFLTRIGWLTGAPAPDAAPRNANFYDNTASLDARARAYLDVNCSHCHSAEGLARTTGLQLDANVNDVRRLGFCKPPVAAGPGTGDHYFDIVPGHADDSILTFRLTATRPGIRMPELGRSLVHREGVELVTQWINSLPGNCQTQ